ncbi:phytoene/squalene synthase family protein [Rhodospirillum centenum]|uniref:phytoene/squalene synthase family protein n=1 Tax=Rhodospirillum centenum TaxID=34018 RepID=UPI0005A06437|nr:phytoene/squalene synthase family protein [Rhodospirillum centenum]
MQQPLLESAPRPVLNRFAPERGDLVVCREMLRTGSRSFQAASLLLPTQVREAATGLYAFCRMADDAVDLGDGGQDVLDRLNERLDRAYAGTPIDDPVDRAFARVVARYGIPKALPAALIEGFAWDAAGRRYEDLSGLFDYSARVAGTVGAMMTLLMGVRDPGALARAADLGVAMQLSNIARDVGEDARNGRIYLPLSWLREAGIDPEAWLADPDGTPGIDRLVRRLLKVADDLYVRAESGIVRLPVGCRPGIYAARFLYAEIGREVERLGPQAVCRRAVVSGRRKLALLLRALAASPHPRGPASAPPLAETAFLVEAVRNHPAPAHRHAGPQRLEDRLIWVLDLFERLERSERESNPDYRYRRRPVVGLENT